MATNKKKYVRFRHNVANEIMRPLVWLYTRLIWNYHKHEKYKIKKGEQVFILSNHQTDVDPTCILLSFNKPINIVATDSLTSSRAYKLLDFGFTPIPIKKGAMDISAIKNIFTAVKQGGNILLFPEGNRTYAEFQYPMGDGLAKLVKKCNITLVLFNLIGGTGKRPRFSAKIRKGRFEGKIVKILKPEEYQNMSDEELNTLIKDYLRVFDSERDWTYKSKRRGEYLERTFFVCPKCGTANQLVSKNEYITCKACNLKVEYGEDLKLHSEDPSFKFHLMNDWYQYQKEWVRNYIVKENEIVFKDDECKLFLSNPFKNRQKLSVGNIVLTDKELIFGDKIRFNLKELTIASAISGKNFNFSMADGNNYLVKGSDRFNALKYVFMFNHLDTHMKEKHVDAYFSLD